jgi:hypothetical protein
MSAELTSSTVAVRRRLDDEDPAGEGAVLESMVDPGGMACLRDEKLDGATRLWSTRKVNRSVSFCGRI